MASAPHVRFYFQQFLVWREVRNNPPFLGGRVGHRGMDFWLRRTAVDELFSLGFTPCVVFSCLLVRNKMTIVVVLSRGACLAAHCSHTLRRWRRKEQSAWLKGRRLPSSPTGWLQHIRSRFRTQSSPFSTELLGGQHWACWRLNHASFITAWSKDLYPKIQTFWCQEWTILCPSLK